MVGGGLGENLSIQYKAEKKKTKEENSIVYRKDMVEVSPYISIITINFKRLVLVRLIE